MAKGLELWLQHQSFQNNSGLISFRTDWFAIPAMQGTLKMLLQHHSLKASILQRSAFFTIHLSYPYMTTGNTTALTIWTFISKVISLLLNKLYKIKGRNRNSQEIEENNRIGKTRDLFKKISYTKRIFHEKMGTIKDRNGMDLTEAEDTKKIWE